MRTRIFLAAACLTLMAAPLPGQFLDKLLDKGGDARRAERRAQDLVQKGKLADAAAAYETALTKAENTYGKDHPTTAQVANDLGNVYRSLGQYAKAEPLYRRALKIRETNLGEGHTLVADSLNNLAMLHVDRAQYDKAEPCYLKSLAIKEAELGKRHPSLADSLNNIALMYVAMGKYDKAEPLYRRSLDIREAKYGPNDPSVADSLTNLAILHGDRGEYAKAEPLYQRALTIRQKKHGPDHPAVADALGNLANHYRAVGQYSRAEPLYLRGLKIKEDRVGRDSPAAAAALNNLAILYKDMGQPVRAEPLYVRSLAIHEASFGPNHPHVAISLNNLGMLYTDLRQFARAEPLHLRGLKIKEASYGPLHPSVAISLNNLAQMYSDWGEYAKAESFCRRSLGIREKKLGKDHPYVAASLNNLAVLRADQGQPGDAADLFDRSRQVSRRHVSQVLPALPPREQAAFLAVEERKHLAAALSLALSRKADPGLTTRSAAWLLNGKAVAEEALAQSALLGREGTPKVAKQLREVRAELARLTLAPPPAGEEKAHRDRLDKLSRQELTLAEKLAREGGVAVSSAGWVGLDELRKQLPVDGVLIDMARLTPHEFNAGAAGRWKPARYVAWVTPAKGAVRLVDLGDAGEIDGAVAEVRKTLEASAKLIVKKGEEAAEKALRTTLEGLSKRVLAPLLPAVGKAKRWVVSPDGNLWLTPWEILLLADGKYAVEKHEVSYVVSGRDLLSATRYRGESGRAVVVADPDFDTVEGESKSIREKPSDEVRAVAGRLPLGQVRRLRGTLQEARAIDKPLTAYARQAPLRYLDRRAQESVVKATKNPRVLVLSTHGFFLAQAKGDGGALPANWENPLVRCGLLLAGCNDRTKLPGGDDGVLTGLEVVGMDLRGCEMVVLSACETGLGDVQEGEGVAGLRQAFRLAGAESVVSTLWQVPDAASARLMTRFFEELAKGKGRPAAMREAQLAMIEERREDKAAAHPFFWAAFTLTGR